MTRLLYSLHTRSANNEKMVKVICYFADLTLEAQNLVCLLLPWLLKNSFYGIPKAHDASNSGSQQKQLTHGQQRSFKEIR